MIPEECKGCKQIENYPDLYCIIATLNCPCSICLVKPTCSAVCGKWMDHWSKRDERKEDATV